VSFRDFRQGCRWSWTNPYEPTGYETTLKSSNRKWPFHSPGRGVIPRTRDQGASPWGRSPHPVPQSGTPLCRRGGRERGRGKGEGSHTHG